ncbi:MAG: L-rhamnose isomerase [Planctomycetota bacterium]
MPHYDSAKQQYADLGVDTDAAIATLLATPVSLHCWQGDDVAGFENTGGELGSGLAVTGNYPGAATTPDQLRADAEQVLKLLPGKHRFNLHAIYLDTDEKVERDAIEPQHFRPWIDWARANNLHGLDFNPTCFAHPKADDGFTLSHPDASVRDFWVRHCRASRKIGAAMGEALGTPTVTNVWIPDGYKDSPADRLAPRQRLSDSLDRVFEEKLDPGHHLDAVESKLFGIGSESYVVGSHEFYLGYALKNHVLPTLDSGHFHPTECISEKVSAVLMFADRLLLHVSRGVRWDSDHVVIRNDATSAILRELVRGDFLGRTHIGLDFFDASINRLAAWTIGVQATQKALLAALLEPAGRLRDAENQGDFTTRLALQEHSRDLPLGEIWNEACRRSEVPEGLSWLNEVKRYEADVLAKR